MSIVFSRLNLSGINREKPNQLEKGCQTASKQRFEKVFITPQMPKQKYAYMPADWFQADEGPIKAPVVPRGPVVDQEGGSLFSREDWGVFHEIFPGRM